MTDSGTRPPAPADPAGAAAALTVMAGPQPPGGPRPAPGSRRARPGARGRAEAAGARTGQAGGGRGRRSAAGGRLAGRGWTAQLPYAVVLAGVVAGLAVISQGQQQVRAGTFTVAGALVVAVVARLALSRRRAGMLASRRRYIDVTALAILAVGLLVAGLVLPTPS